MTSTDVYYDPFTREIWEDPYPAYKRLRDEAPAYYNDKHDFWALSRWEDVDRALPDIEHFSNARGNILEFIQAGMESVPGTLLFEDPPSHDINRALVARLFSPRAVAGLEPAIRDYTVRQLDQVAGQESWDVIDVLSDKVPMRVIGMLVGIPEEMQQNFRNSTIAHLRTEEGQRMDAENAMLDTALFEEYIDWRKDHPSDDMMTTLLNLEFEDWNGVTRRLTRDEILIYCTVVTGAGNDTTGHMMGWTAKLLGEDRHQDLYRDVVANPKLAASAIEEVLRLEPVGHTVARYLPKDYELHGTTIPAGSAALLLVGSAGRDERIWGENADMLDLSRVTMPQQRTFGRGAHYCLGASLARMEGRIVLEELIKRYPKGWDVDMTKARIASTTTVRGWESLIITPRR